MTTGIIPSWDWVSPRDHAQVVRDLLPVIKHDNSRRLPLKKGGTTDVYLNLRDARSHPRVLRRLVDLYMPPLRWLGVDRFVEVPDAVSCIAGPLSAATGIPYLTIRAEAKEGRVADAKMIGNCRPGEKVVIIDDVITDGGSKLGPYQQCIEKGLDVLGILVLADRELGWREEFAKLNIMCPVCAGMRLHDIRRELIASGEMLRCDPNVELGNVIIAALDGKSLQETLSIADRMRPTGAILKVNDLAFAEGFDHLLPQLSVYGRVMLDLKSYDIPNTVSNICKRVAAHRPWAVTVHASGGPAMVREARMALGVHTHVLAVTVLTSFDEKTCDDVYHRRPLDQVIGLAKLAVGAGATGIVCSAEEVTHLRKELGEDVLLVVPGVRSPGTDAGDQKRVDTPARVMANGANFVVMGRQLLGAADPVVESMRVHKEELKRAA